MKRILIKIFQEFWEVTTLRIDDNSVLEAGGIIISFVLAGLFICLLHILLQTF